MKKTKPVKNKAQRLSNALAKISNELVAVGVVDITFGELAKHMTRFLPILLALSLNQI